MGIARGLAYRVAWIYDVTGANEAVVVKNDRGIFTVADLVGKTVGTPYGSTMHYSLMSALQLHDVDLRVRHGAGHPGAGRAGRVAAWRHRRRRCGDAGAGAPGIDGGKVLVTSGDLAEQGVVTADVGIVRDAFATEHPETVRTWLQHEHRAVKHFREDPQAAARAVGTEFGLTPDEAASQMAGLVWLDANEQASPDGLVPAGSRRLVGHLSKNAEFLAEQKLLDQAPSREQLQQAIDGSFLPAG